MKPREFDDLIRQKFEQGGFEYNPANWDRLSEQMDGRSKKRTLVLWWWMPLAGIAASVALAAGVDTLWPGAHTTHIVPKGAMATGVRVLVPAERSIAYTAQSTLPQSNDIHQAPAKATHGKTATQTVETTEEAYTFGISLENALGTDNVRIKKGIPAPAEPDFLNATARTSKKSTSTAATQQTFKPEDAPKTPTLSVTLIGGIAQGSMNSGYMAGATIRRMLNDRVFIESDVAYESSNNSQTTYVQASGARHASARVTSVQSSKTTYIPDNSSPNPVAKDQTYNLSYAQVSPSIGVKLMSRMSLAAGPDFQQALADNRPAPATTLDRNNIAVAPLFDIGMIGKSEITVTKKLKAAVSYRKGINNVLTPMDKYIDRDYLQVQLRCTILNR